MTNDARQAFLVRAFHEARIHKTLGAELSFNAEGEAVCTLRYKRELDHGMNDTHGGIISTLLDDAAWFTVAAKTGQVVVTTDIHVRLLQEAGRQDLVATASIVRLAGKSAITEMRVYTVAGELVATATAAFKVGPVNLPVPDAL